jgi:predicted dehydrogenase
MSQRKPSRILERPSRREFLRTSTAAITGAAAAALPIARSAHAAGSDTIKVGMIGCGDRGPSATGQAMKADPGVRIVAMADLFEDNVRAARDRLKQANPEQMAVDDAHCFAGFDGWKKILDTGIDVVLIACASRFHPIYMKAFLEAGKHVFVEKPHAIDPVGLQTVIAACEEAKKRSLCLVSGLHLRYDPPVVETMKRVQDGAIGDIVAMEVNFMRAPYVVRARQTGWSEIQYQYRNWYHFRWLSGDDVLQSMIHPITVASWAMHDEPPVAAHALGGRSASFGNQYGDVFDHTAVLFEYAKGARMYGFVRTQNGCHGDTAARLMGTKGRAYLVTRNAIEGETKWEYDGPKFPGGGHQMEQTQLFAALRAGKTINNGDYLVRTTQIAMLGQMAVYTGKRMTWNELLKSNFAYEPRTCDFTTQPPVVPDEKGWYPVPIPGVTKLG